MQKAPLHVQDDEHHSAEVHGRIERGDLATSDRGKKSLRTHLARALPVPEDDGRRPAAGESVPAVWRLVVLFDIIEIVALQRKGKSLVGIGLGVSQLAD